MDWKGGYEAIDATDFSQNMPILAEGLSECIISEVTLQSQQSDKWFQCVRDYPRTRAIRVVFISANAGFPDSLKNFNSGTDRDEFKAFLPEKLVTRVGAGGDRVRERFARQSRQ